METFAPHLFRGKTAVVTGGTSGIGAAIVIALARLGAHVFAVGLGADRANISPSADVILRELDVTDSRALQDFYAQTGPIDILVPAAGIALGDREMEWESFKKVVDVQFLATYRTIELALPLLTATSSIVMIASMYSYFGGGKAAAYSASKGGVVQLTKSLAEAYANRGIRVNAVAPGWIDTPLLTPLRTDPQIGPKILARTPLARYGDPSEVADAVCFLSSPAATFVTGSVLPVDGGYLVTGI